MTRVTLKDAGRILLAEVTYQERCGNEHGAVLARQAYDAFCRAQAVVDAARGVRWEGDEIVGLEKLYAALAELDKVEKGEQP